MYYSTLRRKVNEGIAIATIAIGTSSIAVASLLNYHPQGMMQQYQKLLDERAELVRRHYNLSLVQIAFPSEEIKKGIHSLKDSDEKFAALELTPGFAKEKKAAVAESEYLKGIQKQLVCNGLWLVVTGLTNAMGFSRQKRTRQQLKKGEGAYHGRNM